MQTAEQKLLLQKFTGNHKGKKLDQKKMLRPVTMIAKVLIARIMSMTPEQHTALKAVVTPETIPVLKILLPELRDMLNKGLETGGTNNAG